MPPSADRRGRATRAVATCDALRSCSTWSTLERTRPKARPRAGSGAACAGLGRGRSSQSRAWDPVIGGPAAQYRPGRNVRRRPSFSAKGRLLRRCRGPKIQPFGMAPKRLLEGLNVPSKASIASLPAPRAVPDQPGGGVHSCVSVRPRFAPFSPYCPWWPPSAHLGVRSRVYAPQSTSRSPRR